MKRSLVNMYIFSDHTPTSDTVEGESASELIPKHLICQNTFDRGNYSKMKDAETRKKWEQDKFPDKTSNYFPSMPPDSEPGMSIPSTSQCF